MRWTTVDPLWPYEPAYRYPFAPQQFVDPTGLFPWSPPFNTEDGDTRLLERTPRIVCTADPHILPCAACLAYKGVKGDSDGGNTDKGNHFIGGCLARIRCPLCNDIVGSLKELADAFLGGTVSQGDAVATDDGWDYGYWFESGSDVAFCAAGAWSSGWKTVDNVGQNPRPFPPSQPRPKCGAPPPSGCFWGNGCQLICD